MGSAILGGGGLRKQPSMGHTLAELAVHVKLHSKKSKMHLPCIIAPSNFSPVFGSVARTEVRQSRVRQISETPTVACARVEHEALGFSIRMHRIACAHARGTQPAHAHTSHVLLLRG